MDAFSYSETLSEQLSYFVVNDWDIGDVYTITDLAGMFEIDIRLARYHLMKMVDNGILCQVKWYKNTYYLKRDWKKVFIRYKHIGVKVL